MIHGVYANQSSFHPVEFTTGLNVVLAERTDTSSQKDTRNGLGKSTLIEIIDFCLGARVAKGKGLSIEQLEHWEFTLDITLAGNRIKVTRSIKSPNRIVIDGSTSGWIEQPDIDDVTRERLFTLDRWKTFLGGALFELPRSNDAHKYKPLYRSLVSYFIRRGLDAYTDTFRHHLRQNTGDIQLNVGFLLGLNWEYAARWQELKDQEKALSAISQAIKTGAIEDTLGSVGELEAERIQLEGRVERERKALANFRVHPQYKSIQEEADWATANIHELTNQNVADRRLLARYRESVAGEKHPSDVSLEKLYEETGLVFPEAVRRTLDEAKDFHWRIVENRKEFLETEIKRLEDRIRQRKEKIRELTETRASSLEILRTHGALQEMTKLQERHMEIKSRLERVRARISEIKNATSRKRKIKVAKTELAQVAERDHDQRRDIWATAVYLFNDNSLALYKTPGQLVIDIAETGYKYDVEIKRSGSEGVGKMKIFCFDLMLLQRMKQENRIEFLVHDSILYDGVDSRQRALALERAHQVTKDIGAQYICTLNSDMVPRDDFSEGFDFDRYVRLALTDKDPSGSLLGFQFERPTL